MRGFLFYIEYWISAKLGPSFGQKAVVSTEAAESRTAVNKREKKKGCAYVLFGNDTSVHIHNAFLDYGPLTDIKYIVERSNKHSTRLDFCRAAVPTFSARRENCAE